MLQTYRRYHGYFTGASAREPLVTSNVLSLPPYSWMPPVGKGCVCVVSTGHVCSLADLHRRALLLSPSRITTAAPLALSLSPPSAPGAATLFSLPVFFSTLVPPSVDDSPSHNTNRKFARPPISYTFTLAFTSHYLSPIFIPQSSTFLPYFKSASLVSAHCIPSDRLSFFHLTPSLFFVTLVRPELRTVGIPERWSLFISALEFLSIPFLPI